MYTNSADFESTQGATMVGAEEPEIFWNFEKKITENRWNNYNYTYIVCML